MQSAVTGAWSTPLRKWPVAISNPSASPKPIRGALSGVPGRRPAVASTSSSSAISGITRYASRRSSWTPPAVTVVSKPRSSTVAPTISLPSALGTM